MAVRTKRFSISISLLLAVLMVARFSCIALSNFPFMSMKFVFVYGVMFLGIFFFENNRISKHEFICLFFLLTYMIVAFMKTVFNTGNLFNTEAFNAYVLLFLFFIYMYIKRGSIKIKEQIFTVAIIGFAFTYLYSIKWLSVDPNLSRKAAANIKAEQGVDTLNAIGGFDTVYGSILVIIILLFLYKLLFSKWKKIVCCFLIISSIVFILMASYGTAIVLLVIALSLWMMQTNRVFGGIMLGIFILVAVNHVEMGAMISQWSQKIDYSDMLSQKMNEIGVILQTGEVAGTLAGDEGRLARMGWSVETFLKYPIFGAYGKSNALIGYHSELVDLLAKFGAFGFIPLIIFFVCFFKDIYSGLETAEGKRCCILVGIMYIVIAILNPALYTQQVLPIFILLPICESFTLKNNEKG